jgi:hypothetical protein
MKAASGKTPLILSDQISGPPAAPSEWNSTMFPDPRVGGRPSRAKAKPEPRTPLNESTHEYAPGRCLKRGLIRFSAILRRTRVLRFRFGCSGHVLSPPRRIARNGF